MKSFTSIFLVCCSFVLLFFSQPKHGYSRCLSLQFFFPASTAKLLLYYFFYKIKRTRNAYFFNNHTFIMLLTGNFSSKFLGKLIYFSLFLINYIKRKMFFGKFQEFLCFLLLMRQFWEVQGWKEEIMWNQLDFPSDP